MSGGPGGPREPSEADKALGGGGPISKGPKQQELRQAVSGSESAILVFKLEKV